MTRFNGRSHGFYGKFYDSTIKTIDYSKMFEGRKENKDGLMVGQNTIAVEDQDGLTVGLNIIEVNIIFEGGKDKYEIAIDPSGGVDPYWEVNSELFCAFDWNSNSSECTQ